MKKKTYDQSLLINRIVDKIVASDLLEEDKKLLALEDLLQMYKDPEYFKKCEILKYIKTYHITALNIADHHRWAYSRLGEEFWYKLWIIIGDI